MKTLGKILGYLADRIFSGIVMAVALAYALVWLVQNGYLKMGG